MYDYNTLCNNFLQYKKYLGYKYRTDTFVIKRIRKYLIYNKIEKITKEVTEDFARLNKNLDSNTIARNMGVFREFCLYLKAQNVDCYQIPHIIYPQKHRKFVPYIFSHNQIAEMYKNFDKVNTHSDYFKNACPLIIKLLYQTGIRIGELLNIDVEDYNENEKYFILKNTKNGEERLIMLSDKLNNELSIFNNKYNYNKHSTEKFFRLSSSSINKYFHELLYISNIERNENTPRIHDFRHTFVVHNFEKASKEGKDINLILPVLKTHLGHKSTEALLYYFHLTNNILNDINEISENNLSYLIPDVEVCTDE